MQPHWTAYLTAFMTVFIAAFGAWIAFQQWRTAQDKLRLDLFERRMVIYDAARKALGKIFTHGEITPLEETEFLVGVMGSKWLFGKDIHEYLHKEFWEKLAENHMYVAMLDGLPTGAERTSLANKKAELRKWFTAQSDRMDALFLPYLGFPHRSMK